MEKSGLIWAIMLAMLSAGNGVVVKASGLPRGELMFGQFAVATAVMLAWVLLVPNTEAEPTSTEKNPSQWGWMLVRCVLGIVCTFAAYEAFAKCLSIGPALTGLSALYLPLAGFAFPALLVGWKRLWVLLSAAVCMAGVTLALSAATSGTCAAVGIGAGFAAGIGLALLAAVQSQIALAPTLVATVYCTVATLVLFGVNTATGVPCTLSTWSIVMGVVYAVLQVASQIANRWNPVVTSVIGLSQMPLSALASVVVFGERLSPITWFGVSLVAIGVAVLSKGKET
jgi:drug/metabolite transporter (DMT)-like permease